MRIVRHSYPPEVSIILLISLFCLGVLFSYEMFDVRFHNPNHLENAWPGMCLVGVAFVLMIMIVWEELLFHITIKEIKGGLIFRNPKKKLRTQILLYIAIPFIFTFVYFEYDVKVSHLAIWAIACVFFPPAEIYFVGLENHRNYLKLTTRMIKYKNNDKEGRFEMKDIKNFTIIKGERRSINKIQLLFTNNDRIVIDLDEMNLHAFYDSIYKFVSTNYKHMLLETNTSKAVRKSV